MSTRWNLMIFCLFLPQIYAVFNPLVSRAEAYVIAIVCGIVGGVVLLLWEEGQ